MGRKSTIVVIASAGGHLTQAMCATSLVEQDLVLVCNKNMLRGSRFKRIYTVTDTQHSVLIHTRNLLKGIWILLRERPQAMFSTGGPICLPFALLAKLTRTRFVYLDTLSRVTELSNSGKMIEKYGLYDSFLSQWESVAEKYSGVEYHGQAFDLGDHGHQ